jgi:hypothetical protein
MYNFIFAFVAGSNIILQVQWECSEDCLRWDIMQLEGIGENG